MYGKHGEEAIVEICLAMTLARHRGISEILWGVGVSVGAASSPNEKAFKAVDEWTCCSLVHEFSYIYVDCIDLKRSWGGSRTNSSMIGTGRDWAWRISRWCSTIT